MPSGFTPEIYVKIVDKIFASIRHKVYSKIREVTRTKGVDHVTKGQLTDILKQIDVWDIRNKVFDLFGFGELNEPTYKTLIKAHLSFICSDNTFETQIRDLRQSHQRYLTAILAADIFPGLDKIDPLQSREQDVIPEKYGNKWFEYE